MPIAVRASCSAPPSALGEGTETWIGELRPRTPSGLPLAREDLPLLRALEGELVCDVDVLVTVRGGDVLLSASARPFDDPSGRRRGAVMVLEDVTERRAEEAQARAERRSTGAGAKQQRPQRPSRPSVHD